MAHFVKMTPYIVLLFFTVLSVIDNVLSQDCLPRDYGNGAAVCVCNSEHCDIIEELNKVESGKFVKYTSNQAGLRFQKEVGSFSYANVKADNVIEVNENDQYQEIYGFGGAFTDSTCLNIRSLDEDLQNKILRGYFSKDGIEYNLGRVPMAATDFSVQPYTYHDEEDMTLSNFSLVTEDYDLKIPMIKRAQGLNSDLNLFVSTWVAPLWMKVNGAFAGMNGYLKGEMYQVWANYFLKFLDAYKDENVTFWGMTTGNEPFTGAMPTKIPAVAWNSTEMRKWVRENLGPNIRNSAHSDIKIMTLDDQRLHLPAYADEVFEDETAKNYIDGVAVHWYNDELVPASRLDETHQNHPDKFILGTEACAGSVPFTPHVILGSWYRGEEYLGSIIEDVNHWVVGWVDWNMALDLNGGPTYISNFVDSPVIVNATAGEFYRQPMYYGLGHVAKFVPRGSVRIGVSQIDNNVPLTAFKRPDGGIVVVILNKGDAEVSAVIDDANIGKINLDLSSHSFTTIVYWLE